MGWLLYCALQKSKGAIQSSRRQRAKLLRLGAILGLFYVGKGSLLWSRLALEKRPTAARAKCTDRSFERPAFSCTVFGYYIVALLMLKVPRAIGI